MTPFSVVCFKWKPFKGYRTHFRSEHVNTLRRMVQRHYPDRHRFICVTDDEEGLDQEVEVVPLWDDFSDLASPHDDPNRRKNPSCYRRLKAYRPEISEIFGERFVMVDLDCIITGDLRPLWNRPEDFVIYGDTNPQPGSYYNGSMVLMTAGSRRQVWERFDPKTSPQESLKAKCWGSDQGFVSYCLGPKPNGLALYHKEGERKWTREDGVYSWRNHMQGNRRALPENAKMVVFHGEEKPWSQDLKDVVWIQRHYR